MKIKVYNRVMILFVISAAIFSCTVNKNASSNNDHKYSISVDTGNLISKFNKQMLLGVNTGVFYEESYYLNHDFINYLDEIKPGIIRMPGGTWSNELYWNGNKVRLSEESYIPATDWKNDIEKGKNPMEVAFDMSKYNNGKWDVDYSGYAPGFRIKDTSHNLSDFHGFTDVLFLHKFIRAFGAETMVTVNMGTGTKEMAAEWVKWTKQRADYARKPFDVKYWELGNEMDGSWELGYKLPDGTTMNAAEYVRRYKLFAPAMKKADPSIKVGGSVASSMKLKFIKELIQDKDAPIDFISFHAYPANNSDMDFISMSERAADVNAAVRKIKKWLAEFRPDQKDNIEIAVTEWNIKVKEDITTVDITNALWSAVMLGEMAKAGVDIAIQWDIFSTTETGGHGLFNPKDPLMTPRSQYWAMYLWSHFMNDDIYETKTDVPPFVKVYTTKDNNYTSVMIINGSGNEEIAINLFLPERNKTVQGEEIEFSKNQYKLNKETLIPEISIKPDLKHIKINNNMKINLMPNSIKIIRYKNQ